MLAAIDLRTWSEAYLRTWAATADPDEVEALVVAFFRQHEEQEAKQKTEIAAIRLAIHDSIKSRGQCFRRIKSSVTGYMLSVHQARTLIARVDNIRTRLYQTCSLEDLQHPWLQFAMSIASNSYMLGLVPCLNAMEEYGHSWRNVSLVICYVLLNELATTPKKTWAGPYESHLRSAGRILNGNRRRKHTRTGTAHINTSAKTIAVMDCIRLIPAAEAKFKDKSQARKRTAYHRYFRIARVPGESYIILSYCDEDRDIPPIIDPPPELPLSALGTWRGGESKVANMVKAIVTPAPAPPGYVLGEIEASEPSDGGNVQHNIQHHNERQDTIATVAQRSWWTWLTRT